MQPEADFYPSTGMRESLDSNSEICGEDLVLVEIRPQSRSLPQYMRLEGAEEGPD